MILRVWKLPSGYDFGISHFFCAEARRRNAGGEHQARDNSHEIFHRSLHRFSGIPIQAGAKSIALTRPCRKSLLRSARRRSLSSSAPLRRVKKADQRLRSITFLRGGAQASRKTDLGLQVLRIGRTRSTPGRR